MKLIPKQCVSCPNMLSTSANSEPFCCRYMESAVIAVRCCTLTGHVSVATNTEKLLKLIEMSGVSQEAVMTHMDEMVHATKAKEAMTINKEGLAAQISYLFTSRVSFVEAKMAIQSLIQTAKVEEQESAKPLKLPILQIAPSTQPSDNELQMKKQSQRRYRR